MEKTSSFTNVLSLLKIFMKLRSEKELKHIKVFINEYYSVEEMPEDFYILFSNKIHSKDYLSLFNNVIKGDIYSLVSYLKYNHEDVVGIEEVITPSQYYIIPQRYINRIVENLKKLEIMDNSLSEAIKEEAAWLLRKTPVGAEYRAIAYKMYLSIGLDNSLELSEEKYGKINYEQIHFMFSKLNTKDSKEDFEQQLFNNFLFDNKKDPNNITRQILNGSFKELFLNFDYFYNNFSYFINQLGIKMSKNKVKALLNERYLLKNPTIPEITGDISEDMLSSYYCKYEVLDTAEEQIYSKNYQIYNEFLKNKYKSSIPMIKPLEKEKLLCEVIKLSDPRNLVLGYRAGNCFRINGDAQVLFRNFLQSEHMRLLSVSTIENKDYAMMLIMRNGNVLIGQGIETSNWVPTDIKGKKLYDACREVLKQMMEYMNSMGDEIVATVIGSSNSNVSDYNNQILPFLINPILGNTNNYYNGIYNYQCLLDLKEGKTLNDIKLYTPSVRYLDEREEILRRTNDLGIVDNNYREIEKRLRALRFLKMQREGNANFYKKLLQQEEIYTACNKDWYITLFDDGTIDSFISEDDERANAEYNKEIDTIQGKISKRK